MGALRGGTSHEQEPLPPAPEQTQGTLAHNPTEEGVLAMDPKHLELATRLRRELHRHPEVSGQEQWTKQRLIGFLREHTGLDVVDRGKWFYAVYRAGEGRRNIAFRADFDAIPMPEGIELPHGSRCPGVAHKCGHDGHAASLAAFALEIAEHGARDNIFFLFQHAEENAGGAIECASLIREQGIDEMFAYHNMSGIPYGAIGVIDGTSHCASKGMIIRMNGRPAHASQPELGANPAFAIAKVIDAIPELIRPDRYQGMVLCTVIQVDIGERAFGISASRGDLLLTIRALYEAEMDRLEADIQRLAREQADRYGLEVRFCYNDVFPETVNHKQSSDKIRRVCRAQGRQLVELTEARRGSEDYGYYLKETKGAMCFIGNGEDYPALHTTPYDFRDELIGVAVELFMGLVRLDSSSH